MKEVLLRLSFNSLIVKTDYVIEHKHKTDHKGHHLGATQEFTLLNFWVILSKTIPEIQSGQFKV